MYISIHARIPVGTFVFLHVRLHAYIIISYRQSVFVPICVPFLQNENVQISVCFYFYLFHSLFYLFVFPQSLEIALRVFLFFVIDARPIVAGCGGRASYHTSACEPARK